MRQVDYVIPTLSERSRLQRRKSLGQLQSIESPGLTSELPVGIALYFEAMAAAKAAAEAERLAEIEREAQARQRAAEAARLAAAQAEAERLAQQLELEAARRLAEEQRAAEEAAAKARQAQRQRELELKEKQRLAALAVEAKEPRAFDQALTAIEANPWLECGIWLIAISIDAFSALRSLLKEHQPRQRASAALLSWSSELGRLTWPRTLKQWCLETSNRLLAAAKTRAA